tara:strand:+ start:10583 stop:11833 length:1251 start_codon:yes stop_codon:yes gene_type:complete
MDKEERKKQLDFAIENELLNDAMIEIESSTGNKVDINGKLYTKVSGRLQILRQNLGFNIRIKTELLHIDTTLVVAKAEIFIYKDQQWFEIATGHAEELRDSSEINKYSAVENAETSAIGRALASLGLSGDEYASVEELLFAKRRKETAEAKNGNSSKETIKKGNPPSPQLFSWMSKLISDTSTDIEKFLKHFNAKSIKALDENQVKEAIEILKRKKNKVKGLNAEEEERKNQQQAALSVLQENKEAEKKPKFTKINTDTGEEKTVESESKNIEDDIVIDDEVVSQESEKEVEVEDNIVESEEVKELKEEDILVEKPDEKTEKDLHKEEGKSEEVVETVVEDPVLDEKPVEKKAIKPRTTRGKSKSTTKPKSTTKSKPAKGKSTKGKSTTKKDKKEEVEKPREIRPNDLDDSDEITI